MTLCVRDSELVLIDIDLIAPIIQSIGFFFLSFHIHIVENINSSTCAIEANGDDAIKNHKKKRKKNYYYL